MGTSVKPKPNLRLKPPPMLTMATTAVDTDITVWDITVMVPDTMATTDMPVTVTLPTPTAASTSVRLKPNLKPKPPLMLTMDTTVMPAATFTAAPKVCADTTATL